MPALERSLFLPACPSPKAPDRGPDARRVNVALIIVGRARAESSARDMVQRAAEVIVWELLA
jgi:hypothetical protein